MSESHNVTNTYHSAAFHETYTGVEPHRFRSEYQDKIGDNTPDWPRNIQTNDYLRSKFVWHQQPYSVSGSLSNGDSVGGQWGISVIGNVYPWDGNPFWSTNDMRDEVSDKLYYKLISQIQSNRVNLGEIFFTRKQTADLIVSTANRLEGAVRALRRGNLSGAVRQLTGNLRYRSRLNRAIGGIPEQWLALKYGWQPLLQDVYNSVQTVAQAWSNNGSAFTCSAKAHSSRSGRSIKYGPSSGFPSVTFYETSCSVQGNASITYGVDSTFTKSLSQMGVTNPLSVAWELLPWSFVVDWFLPIGNYLDALDYARGLVFKHGWLSIKSSQSATSRVTDNHVHRSYPSGITQDDNWSGGDGQGEAMVFTRSALGSFPSPPLPRLKDPFSSTHVANALSLLATAFGR
jgi:hypothetical protein